MTVFAGQTYRVARSSALSPIRERFILWPSNTAPTRSSLYWHNDALWILITTDTSPSVFRDIQAQAIGQLFPGYPFALFHDEPRLARSVSHQIGRVIGIGQGIPNGVYQVVDFLSAAQDAVQGIVFPDDTDDLHDRVGSEVFAITTPGHRDSDGVIQPELPDNWENPPGWMPSDFERAIFQATRVSTQPAIPEGTVTNITDQDGNSYNVNLPAFPSRELVQGILQGVVVDANTVDRTITLDGDNYEMITATYESRNRYDVLLERRRIVS